MNRLRDLLSHSKLFSAIGLSLAFLAAGWSIHKLWSPSSAAAATATSTSMGKFNPAALEKFRQMQLPPIQLGNPNTATVIISCYVSPTCSHCAQFHTATLPWLKRTYIDTGRMLLRLHLFVLNALDMKLAQLVWTGNPKETLDRLDALYVQQGYLVEDPKGDAVIQKALEILDISEGTAKDCFANEALVDRLVATRLVAEALYRIDGTPTFLINDKKIEEVITKENFAQLMAREKAKL